LTERNSAIKYSHTISKNICTMSVVCVDDTKRLEVNEDTDRRYCHQVIDTEVGVELPAVQQTTH